MPSRAEPGCAQVLVLLCLAMVRVWAGPELPWPGPALIYPCTGTPWADESQEYLHSLNLACAALEPARVPVCICILSHLAEGGAEHVGLSRTSRGHSTTTWRSQTPLTSPGVCLQGKLLQLCQQSLKSAQKYPNYRVYTSVTLLESCSGVIASASIHEPTQPAEFALQTAFQSPQCCFQAVH